jgi:hypothetical protein
MFSEKKEREITPQSSEIFPSPAQQVLPSFLQLQKHKPVK